MKGNFHGIFGYRDDNFLLAHSLAGLQETLNTCEEYAKSHNLKFSTNPEPAKCKTRCIAFLKRQRDLPSLKLCGNNLPWVTSGKHLGNTIQNKMDGMKLDFKQKRCQYITKNNDILQEFFSSHPESLLKVNQIYNTHFTGSALWKLFCEDSTRMESVWNKSVKLMMDLPLSTHRRLIEPLSDSLHISKILVKRFLGFLSQIEKSGKFIAKQLLNVVKFDVRSTTGFNLRKIMLCGQKTNVEKVNIRNVRDFKYHPLTEEERWKVGLVKELNNVKFGKLELENFSEDEIDELISFACIS